MVDAERACSLASMILIDDDVAVTGDKIMAILDAAKVKGIPPFLPPMFAGAISAGDPRALFMQLGGGSGAGVSSVAAPADCESTETKGAGQPKKEEKKPVESESDDDMGLDLFG